ncbi:WbqC family protein [Flavilitoribacter nigricans]|uniref:WbqC family protein n=1 Tax=Flavilitoribacter nigricans (strain ATCC 23147 / DSM 23189 / NBRC 102662 / NCIMB 1420 / SS-2) TaxID=1122177 RepID=A0A2D0MYV3_FLAN2|nr:WbqC family protein [Flavilitoribacter nigricans]PHN01472.1 hypothetical protein CRP01_36840 [Flavilitoribacter nigricans DSM 23189 = NBRC 102662]
MKRVAIHQPNYLPWLGYFYKIFAADQFIFLDDVAYSKGSYTARTSRRNGFGQTDKSYLSVPVKKHHLGTAIKALEINHLQDWPARHLNCLIDSYRKAPFFEKYFPALEAWFQHAFEFELLSNWNIYLVQEVSQMLGLDCQFINAASIPVSGKGPDYLLALVRYRGGEAYISGAGGRKYQDPGQFLSAGIDLKYQDLYPFLEQYPYSQFQGPWLNGLSVIDALMNIGEDAILKIFQEYERGKQWSVC